MSVGEGEGGQLFLRGGAEGGAEAEAGQAQGRQEAVLGAWPPLSRDKDLLGPA